MDKPLDKPLDKPDAIHSRPCRPLVSKAVVKQMGWCITTVLGYRMYEYMLYVHTLRTYISDISTHHTYQVLSTQVGNCLSLSSLPATLVGPSYQYSTSPLVVMIPPDSRVQSRVCVSITRKIKTRRKRKERKRRRKGALPANTPCVRRLAKSRIY